MQVLYVVKRNEVIFLNMGTVVGTCMPDIEIEQTTTNGVTHTTLAPTRRRRYGKYLIFEIIIF